ncbi:MAG: major capsid protein [Melioribacteraceae bacterium]|nr:major capsid protein [Melioribacteraceae bacterium]
MSDRLKNLRVVDEVLTNVARGYTNANFIGTHLFPIIKVSKEGGKIPQFNAEAFKIYNTERAIRAKSNRISPDGRSTIDYVLTEHDLEYPMDYREIDEDIANLELHAANVTSEGIGLRLEKMIADLSQDSSNYPGDNVATLAPSDKFTEQTSNPFEIIDTAREAVRSKIARYPNTIVIGASTFAALKNHQAVLSRIKYTTHSILTEQLLRQLLDVENLHVGKAVYINDAGDFVDVWNDNIILAYVPEKKQNVSRNVYEPSFAYTLRKKSYPLVDKYPEGGKVSVIRNTDIFVPKIVGADAGFLIEDTN